MIQKAKAKHWVSLWQSCFEEGGGTIGNRFWNIEGKHTETSNQAHGHSQSLNQQPGGLHGTDLGSLHICDCCVTWSIYGVPGNGRKGYPQCFD